MGCNSHISVEVQYDQKWEPYAIDVPESRDYNMYELMAGVRGDEDASLVMPRGIPADISEMVGHWHKRWDADGHTPSHLTAQEFRNVIAEYKKNLDCEDTSISKYWLALEAVLTALETIYGKDKARIVFFFDN